jgi:phage baseplate assembly protein W
MVQKVKQSNIFIGFSSEGATPDKTKLFDIELVKRDLLNHLYTARGERVMNPEYGSIIWELLFEPLTEGTAAMIVDDVTRIVNSERRLQLQNCDIEPLEHGIRIKLDLLFLPYDIVDTMFADFDKRSYERRGGV